MTELQSALDAAAHWPVAFTRGQAIYHADETPKAMYRVDQGCVRLQINGADGDRQIIAFLFPGDLFGFALDRRLTAAEAVTDVALTRYSLESVLDLTTRSRQVTVQLLNSANALYADLAENVRQIIHLPARERVVWFLNWLVAHEDTDGITHTVALPMSRRDIGDFLGLAPETLSRVFKQLRAHGHVTLHGRKGFTLNPPAFALHVAHMAELDRVRNVA